MEKPIVIRKKNTRKAGDKVSYTYYYQTNGRKVTTQSQIDYLDGIKVPASYQDVVMSLKRGGKLLAQGVDGSGTKQYFYSSKFRAAKTKNKNCNLIHLGNKLVRIQRDIDLLLKKGLRIDGNGINDEVLNALALKIMFICNFRVGSTKGVREHQTYGLTTLNGKHVKIGGSSYLQKGGAKSGSPKTQALIEFLGKKQQWNRCVVQDEVIVGLLRKLSRNYQKLGRGGSGTSLLSWDGYKVTPRSLNNFLARYHPDITTKTWRTWYANLEFIKRINRIEIPEYKTYRKKLVDEIVIKVASNLHHTPAVSKRAYLMSELPKFYMERPDEWEKTRNRTRTARGFLMSFLKNYCQKSK
jgi:DNA topoisomerase-1